MTPAECLEWLSRNHWTSLQLAQVSRVPVSTVRAWLAWQTRIPTGPAFRLTVCCDVHRKLLQWLEAGPTPPGNERPSADMTFADLVKKHCPPAQSSAGFGAQKLGGAR